jgi:lipocalin
LFLPAVGERIVELLRSVVKLLLWWRRDSSPLEVVQGLELDSFLGTWYEIASIKRSFQRDLGDVTAQYSLSDKPNVLKVTNAGRRKEGKGAQASISGTARLLNPKKGAGKFKITFRVLGGVLPLMAPYWVSGLTMSRVYRLY